jgi:diguanylate cyclase (GGDEF)-like protein
MAHVSTAHVSVQQKAELLLIHKPSPDFQMLSDLLTEQGYQVEQLRAKELAMDLIKAKQPDMILLDAELESQCSDSLCKRLKDTESTTDIPIIFLIDYDSGLDKVQTFQVGAVDYGGVDYIAKPFRLAEVLARVEGQLTLLRQHRQLTEQNIQLRRAIEQQQQTEDILYQSRALLSSILNSSLDGLTAAQAIRDDRGQIEDFQCLVLNPVAAKILSPQDPQISPIHKMTLGRALEPIDPRLFEALVQVVETGNTLERECQYQAPGSGMVWLHIIGVKLGDGLALTLRDVTRQKRAQAELERANLELERLANLDGLTQVANRRRFDSYLEQEWKRLQREQAPLGLILCDVDYFKLFNDYYGHQAGDDCLRQIAQGLQSLVQRPADLVTRYGGEEFAVILPNTPLAGTQKVAEWIRVAIKDLRILHTGAEGREFVTLSLGVANLVPRSDQSVQILFAQADQALYEAKKGGRDRVVVFDSGTHQNSSD